MAERLSEKDELRIRREIHGVVRATYAAAAKAASGGSAGGCGPDGCGCGETVLREEERAVYGAALYEDDEREALPDAAKLASLGCGNPTAVAELHEGETVLDLGSGGGIDVLLSARRVGPSGKAIGLDMTDEMLELARRNQREANVENVEFIRGTIEEIPLPDDSVDAVISNCVISLTADKSLAFREAARVLRPGGRFAVTDVVADEDMPDEVRLDIAEWSGCVGGALTPAQIGRGLTEAGLEDVEIRETHRVNAHAGSAIVRARKPVRG
jgi:arsenite methyltransferase